MIITLNKKEINVSFKNIASYFLGFQDDIFDTSNRIEINKRLKRTAVDYKTIQRFIYFLYEVNAVDYNFSMVYETIFRGKIKRRIKTFGVNIYYAFGLFSVIYQGETNKRLLNSFQKLRKSNMELISKFCNQPEYYTNNTEYLKITNILGLYTTLAKCSDLSLEEILNEYFDEEIKNIEYFKDGMDDHGVMFRTASGEMEWCCIDMKERLIKLKPYDYIWPTANRYLKKFYTEDYYARRS